MEDNKISGSKAGAQTMLFYYLYSLMGKVKDPKQVVATELGKMIDLSEEQINYVQLNLSMENTLLANLESSISLLKVMKTTGKLDIESLQIVISMLDLMRQKAEKLFIEDVEEQEE